MKTIKLFIAKDKGKEFSEIGDIYAESLSDMLGESILVAKDKPSELEKIYARLREQVNSENNLYTQRIYWLIFIQAFLFATAGLVLQVMFQPEGTPRIVHLLTFFLLVVAGLGMFVGVVCHFLFSGAREALIELGEMWADTIKRQKDDGILDSFPDVRGGRAKKGLERGNERYNSLFRSGNLGIAFAIAWLVLVILGGFFLSTSVGVEDNVIGGQTDHPAILEQDSGGQ